MRYSFVAQHDSTDCAAACLAMVCLHYKREASITKLRDLMGTDIAGTSFVGLIDSAHHLGFDTKAVEVDADGLLSDFSKPCIANIITEEGLSHFIVVYKIQKKVVIGDPASGIRRIPIDEFINQFTGIILLLKPKSDFYAMPENHDGSSGYRRYIRLLLPQKKLFVFSIIASIIITTMGIISSLFNKIVLDEILPYKLQNMLLAVVIIFALVEITKVIVGFLREFIMIYLSQRIDISLMLGYFSHIFELPMRLFATRKTGDIITRFSDAFTIKEIFTNIALTLFMDITMAVFTGVVLFNMDAGLFGITILLVMISLIIVLCFRHPYKTINIKQMQQASVLNSEIIEGLRAIEMIKSNSIEQRELEYIENEYIKSLRFSFKEGKESI